jgi:hypothetical protein
MVRGSIWSLVVALVLITATGCGVHGLSLVQDTRVHIVTPSDRSKVALPVTVQWTSHGFIGSFGVLVDRAPPPPGKTLAWLFRNACRGCANPAYLAARDVDETSATVFTVDQIAPSATSDDHAFHQVTIILLDAHGARIGEGAWTVEFKVPGHK